MKYKNAVCKGSYFLGTACGNCERCEEEKIRQTDLPGPGINSCPRRDGAESSGVNFQDLERAAELEKAADESRREFIAKQCRLNFEREPTAEELRIMGRASYNAGFLAGAAHASKQTQGLVVDRKTWERIKSNLEKFEQDFLLKYHPGDDWYPVTRCVAVALADIRAIEKGEGEK